MCVGLRNEKMTLKNQASKRDLGISFVVFLFFICEKYLAVESAKKK
jgi:hypothetical protein